jgi:glycosyltransferase involved in cell wall biosynthesis
MSGRPTVSGRSGRVCIFIPGFGDGGVEHMLVNLARGVARLGHAVDFIVRRAEGPYLHTLPDEVEVIELNTAGAAGQCRRLVSYLDAKAPDVLLSAKMDDDKTALRARRRTRAATRLVLRPGTTFTARLEARRRNFVVKWLTRRRLRRLFAGADGIVAVSRGVADDIIRLTGVPPSLVTVIPNPVIVPELFSLAEEAAGHPWLDGAGAPVVIGVGGLRRQKDFPTLVRAFARVRARRPCRLVILGEGRQRRRLLRLANELGVGPDVALPGFVANPYAWLAKSRLFVLSSLWEGSPNVLTEALAVGTPVVATDCPSGPREILQEGRYGRLVPPGDVGAMASAMSEALDEPVDRLRLRSAIEQYTMEQSASRYLRYFGLIGSEAGDE